MSCSGQAECNCGCCAGTAVQTPQAEVNRAGLPAIAYRAGSWVNFKQSMLARLSSADFPALQTLKTRDDDDFTLALLDATAVVLDVLAFYQERVANENYLRTASDPRSLVELSHLIGYEPAPGVSAECYVAFTLKTAPGQTPNPNAPAISIPKGTQMQSVPGQDAKPQTFETSDDIPAKPDWNALAVQTGTVWRLQNSDRMYLQGTATQLQAGDVLLMVGERGNNKVDSDDWTLVVLTKVEVDTANGVTYVEWDTPMNQPKNGPSAVQKVYAMRQRASLFGYNAVDPNLFTAEVRVQLGNLLAPITPAPPAPSPQRVEWSFPTTVDVPLVDLDAVYSKLTPGGWLVLIRTATDKIAAGLSAYQIISVQSISHSAYAISARVTRATVDTVNDLDKFYTVTRGTSVLAQSEELAVPLQPLLYPLYGTQIELQENRPDLANAKVVAVTGKRQKLRVKTAMDFIPDEVGGDKLRLDVGAIITITSGKPLQGVAPADWSTTSVITLNVEDASGRPGTVKAALNNFTLAPSDKSDPFVSECAVVQAIEPATDRPRPHTRINTVSGLVNCYERKTTTVNANVVLATHGQSVSEIVGSGSATSVNQQFTLKQSPLTYVHSETPTGRSSTLEVQVSGVKWKEVPALFQQPASASVFATQQRSDGKTDVVFGDSVEGSTLPTGQNNVRASYRIGSGAAGNVDAGTLTTLMDRPLGVNGVTNPEPAAGGQDAQSPDDIRKNAPQTVLTLGRAVSIADYQSYAATFAGISKVYAIWIPSGHGRGVFLTVAGVNGQALDDDNPILAKLLKSLRKFGNPLIPVSAKTFMETLFSISADVKYDPAYDQPTVQAAVRNALTTTYSFANRSFGHDVSSDEIASVIQAVPGVVAVNVKKLTPGVTSIAGDLAGTGKFTIPKLNEWLAKQVTTFTRPSSDTLSRICAYLPTPSFTQPLFPAEILVLDPDPKSLTLGVMP